MKQALNIEDIICMVIPAHEYIIIKNEADEVVYALQITIIRYHWFATSEIKFEDEALKHT